jgi:hypothetical protein
MRKEITWRRTGEMTVDEERDGEKQIMENNWATPRLVIYLWSTEWCRLASVEHQGSKRSGAR